MCLRSTRKLLVVLILILLASIAPATLAAPQLQLFSCAEDYTIQAGDWISTIAEKYYGDVLAYTAIVMATNMATNESSKYTGITNPNLIEVGQVLCIPGRVAAQAMINGQFIPPKLEPVLPDGKMLVIAGNRTLENIPATLTLSGGQFGPGQAFALNAGQEIHLDLEPGIYQANWSLPEGLAMGRTFRAVAGRVAIGWIVPEENYTFFELQPSGPRAMYSTLGQLILPSVMTSTTPYSASNGKALLVAGNRTLGDIASTLTLSGGQFGGGQPFFLNRAQELLIALEPGRYHANWSVPAAEADPFSLSGDFTVVAGRTGIIWIVPEMSRAFFQRPGEAGQELR